MSIKKKYSFYKERIKSGRLKQMKEETIWIYQYAKKYRKVTVFYTVLGLCSSLIGIVSAFISKDLVDIITGHKTGEVIRTFVIMIGVSLFNIMLSQLIGYLSNKISMNVEAQIKSDIFEKILKTEWESLSKYHTGDLLSRWSSDASMIANGVLSFLPNLIINIFKFISAFAVVVYNDWTFALFALAGIPVSLLFSKKIMTRMQNNNRRSAQMSARLTGFNQETFANIQTIKAFDLIDFYSRKQRDLSKETIDMRLEFSRMSIFTSIILSIVSLMVSYSSYGWGIYRVWSGHITYGTMTMFLSMAGTLTGSVSQLATSVPSIISITTSARRLMDIIEMPLDDYDHYDEARRFIDTYSEKGLSLIVENLSYSYNNSTEVFHEASFEGHSHEIIGLVGPSGEGKTTMLRLLLSLLRIKDGRAYLEADGQTMDLTPSTRQAFSYVPQGNTIFSGTIEENMRNVKEDASKEEIIEALKLSCAWEFVEKLPDGIDTMVMERGVGLSEGQSQRLAIARALLRRSPILLLDEASSALDVATERKVLKNIMKDSYPRICIITTHRPTVLTMCDRVYCIKDMKCELMSEEEINEMIKDF